MWAAAESLAIGYGGDAIVSTATGLARVTVRKGRRELARGGPPVGRIRRPGAGRPNLPMAHGFMYLVAIMDWYSRRVLAWRVSNTFDSDFCVEALKDALTRYGPPEIFNTDQGAQFTSKAFTTVLKTHAVAISMDGKGRFMET